MQEQGKHQDNIQHNRVVNQERELLPRLQVCSRARSASAMLPDRSLSKRCASFTIGLLVALLGAQALAAPPPRFPPGAIWHRNVSQAPLHPNSSSMIASLTALGGFGFENHLQIDFGLHIVRAPVGSPTRNIVGYPTSAEYYSADCEPVGTPLPVPATAAIEAQDALFCNNAEEDCHLLVVQGRRLYEAFRANSVGAKGLQAQCLVLWKLDAIYPPDNRGEHCTSADAAGFPIAPLLFNADEVFAGMQVNGDLGHAIRFTLPNERIATTIVNGERVPQYVRPASHAGGPSGPATTVPYGARLRLRASFPVQLYPPAARVILRTLQRYGMVLADGGNIPLTAESDKFTTHKWAELGIDSRTFDLQVPSAPVRAQDFSVINTGARIIETYECLRNPDMALTR